MPNGKVTSSKPCSHCGGKPGKLHGNKCVMDIIENSTLDALEHGPSHKERATACLKAYPNNSHGRGLCQEGAKS